MNQELLIKSAAIVLVGLVAGVVVNSLVNRAIQRVAVDDPLDERRQRLATIWSIGRRVMWILVAVILGWTLAVIWAIPSTPFLAVGSAVGVALGFGAQDLVKDVIAGFFIVSEDQFHVGDVVRVGGVAGTVEDLRLRVTVLRDLDGVVHYIPNGQITVTSNLTQQFSRVVIDVGVAYATDLDRALDVLGDELRSLREDPEWEHMLLEEPEILGVDQLGDSAVVLRAVLTAVPAFRWDVKRQALKRVKQRFDAEGIVIPFPQIRVWQGREPDPEPDTAETSVAHGGESGE